MIDTRWDKGREAETRVMIVFGDTTSTLTLAIPNRSKLVLENADTARALAENFEQETGPATLFELLTQDDDLIEEMRAWLKANQVSPTDTMLGVFHVYSDVPNVPAGQGVFGSKVMAVVRDENTATLFKLFFAGRAP